HHPPGRSIRPQFTKLLTNLKQQTAYDLSFAPDNLKQHPEITRKKPAVWPAFRLHHQTADV
ncbi:hypothetical protein FGF94_23910, partial [Salmonella sp. zj-f54]|nr:hypothetical protein [Salmonella sp. zj-f54]